MVTKGKSRTTLVPTAGRISRGRARATGQFVIRVTMHEIDPPIWRLLRVPVSFTLHRLHRVLQVVFSRLDYHLYEFRVADRRFQYPDPEAGQQFENATLITLADLGLAVGEQLLYVYDFGDNWKHDLMIEEFIPMPSTNGPDWSPRLLAGGRAAPPEDAGGVSGYERVVDVLSNPRHPEYDDYRQWAGLTYDPASFDAWSVDHALALAVGWGAI